jgi:hypothetical protein
MTSTGMEPSSERASIHSIRKGTRSVPGLEPKFLLFGAGQERDSVLSRIGDRALAASAFGSDHAPASTRALVPAFPDAFEFFRPPKYPGIPPSPRESHENTKTSHLLDHGARFHEGWGIPWTPVWPGMGIVAAWFAAGDWDGRHSLRRTQPARISDPKQHVHAAKARPNYIAPNIRVRSSRAKRCNTLLWLR